MCGGPCKGENFLFIHDEPLDFVVSHWQKNRTRTHIGYFIYRLLAAAFVTVNYVLYLLYGLKYDIVSQFQFQLVSVNYQVKKQYFFQAFYPIYLTHWGWTLVLLFQVSDLLLVTIEFLKQRRSKAFESR